MITVAWLKPKCKCFSCGNVNCNDKDIYMKYLFVNNNMIALERPKMKIHTCTEYIMLIRRRCWELDCIFCIFRCTGNERQLKIIILVLALLWVMFMASTAVLGRLYYMNRNRGATQGKELSNVLIDPLLSSSGSRKREKTNTSQRVGLQNIPLQYSLYLYVHTSLTLSYLFHSTLCVYYSCIFFFHPSYSLLKPLSPALLHPQLPCSHTIREHHHLSKISFACGTEFRGGLGVLWLHVIFLVQ